MQLLPTKKEIAATLLFVAAGVTGVLLASADWAGLAPAVLFYAVLVVNTYYSIRFFSNLPPTDRNELVIDGALVVLYVVLGLSIGNPLIFTFVAFALFVCAIVKYALLRALIDYPQTLRRKMLIDLLGTLLCAAVFVGTVAGFATQSVWSLAIVFTVANVYLLAIDPMYRVFDSQR